MTQDKRLAALIRASDAVEQEALQERKRIDLVLSQRQQAVDSLREEESRLQREIDELSANRGKHALLTGDARTLSVIKGYSRRLSKRVQELEGQLRTKEADLSLARQRLVLAEEELVNARVERKKLERLVSSQERKRLGRNVAEEELNVDEISGFRASTQSAKK